VRPPRFLSDQTRATRTAAKMMNPYQIAETIVAAMRAPTDGQKIMTVEI
jgi:hypothetical protein